MHNLTSEYNPDWALFLPALSTFFISGLGLQRSGQNYFPPERLPQQMPDVEVLNFLNQPKSIFPYKWALYSAGHADLDINASAPKESIVRERDPGTFLLGDSGGFQILKGQWPADWKNPNCPRAMKKRKDVLAWMDKYMNYGMCLDIPSQSLTTYHLTDKNGKSLHGIKTIDDAIAATHINNEYFIKHRSGACKFLNVLQGRNHTQSEDWYNEMKKYCDPKQYPDNHFNGWAFGGQTKIDPHLFLIRLLTIVHDGFLTQGKHDWIHCLGTSITEYAVFFTEVQRALRKYHNPDVTISFDCASPFFGAAKGLAYTGNTFEHGKKWTYAMEKTAENRDYSTDTRPFMQGVLDDKIHSSFVPSPITDKLVMKDLCYRGRGFIGQHGKETRTSWDTLSYTLIQAHNVYMHIMAVVEANKKYEAGVLPKMLQYEQFERILLRDVIDEIFRQPTLDLALDAAKKYDKFWMQFQSGQGFSGKKTVNSTTMFSQLFNTSEQADADDDYEDDNELVDLD